MDIAAKLSHMGIDDDEAVQRVRDMCATFETRLQQAETQYIRQGLRFHCMISLRDSSSFEARQLSAAFVVDDKHIPESNPSNTLMTKIEHLQRQLCKAKELIDANRLQASEDVLKAADVGLWLFNADLGSLGQVARELVALSGLQELSVDAKADDIDERVDINFRANKALWCWVMELPLVKTWLAEGRVVSEEHAFVKLVKHGDAEVQKQVLWMAG